MNQDPTVGDNLLLAIHARDLAGLKAAIRAGANVNAHDLDGWTPLMHAIRFGDLPSVRELLDAGADPQLDDEFGWTAYAHGADSADSVIRDYMAVHRSRAAAA